MKRQLIKAIHSNRGEGAIQAFYEAQKDYFVNKSLQWDFDMISFVLINKEPDQPTTVSGDLLGI